MIVNKDETINETEYNERKIVRYFEKIQGDDGKISPSSSPPILVQKGKQILSHQQSNEILSLTDKILESYLKKINNEKISQKIQDNLLAKQNLINEILQTYNSITQEDVQDCNTNTVSSKTLYQKQIEDLFEYSIKGIFEQSIDQRSSSDKKNANFDGKRFTKNNESKSSEKIEEKSGQKKDSRSNFYLSRKSLHTSSLSLEDYFNQDADSKKKAQLDRIVNDITKFKSYFVCFRLRLFIEFYFYHALFFILGPIANPIIYYFGKGLPRNLFFWGYNQHFFQQICFYLLSLSAVVLFLCYRTNFVDFQAEITYFFLGILFRIYTICTKYATFDPYKIEAIKNNVFQPEDLKKNFFLFDWREQNDRIVYEEIYFAQRAYEIDTSWFYLEFMVNPEQETKERINKHNFVLRGYHSQKEQQFQPEPINISHNDIEIFYNYGIIKEIVDSFQKKYQFIIVHIKTISCIYSIIRCLIPTINKLVDKDLGYIENAKWYEWIISINIAFLTYQLYFYTVSTIFQGIIDMKRKIYMMEQMAFMISPRKLRNIDVDKIFPTINIFKSSNLKAWQLARQVCQEYGKRYDIRVQANFTGMVLAIVCEITILCLYFTEVVVLEQSFIIIIIIETIFSLITFVQILYSGAQINKQFEIHHAILTLNKSIVTDIFRMRKRYFCNEFKTPNYLYAKAIQKIKDEVNTNNFESHCIYIKEIVEAYDTHIDELKFDQHQNPFKIGSLKITSGLLESGVVGIISVIAAIIGKFLSNKLAQ